MTRNVSPLSDPTRRRIDEHVRTKPGIHFNAIARDLDLAPGQVQYHVHRLLDSNRLVATSLYGKTHYYPPEFDGWERGVLALFRRETARGILLYLLQEGSAAPDEVADALDVARSTLEWHLDHLIEQDVVEKRRPSGNRVTLVVARPGRTERLLQEVTPSTPDRLADRFLRLVDQLFEEGDPEAGESNRRDGS